jgi:hypothetical protein
MGVVHRLVGYSRKTDRMVERYDIPPSKLDQAIVIAAVDDDDPDAISSYALSAEQADGIADLIGVAVDCGQLEFFLEAFAAPAARNDP